MSKCAISTNAQNQDGRPDWYWKLKKRMNESAKATPPPPRNLNVRHIITQKAREPGNEPSDSNETNSRKMPNETIVPRR